VPLRAGRRAASLRVSMTQMGRRILEAIAWVTAGGDGLAHDVARMPAVPAPEQLRPIEALTDEPRPYRFWENLECRPTRFVPPREREPGAPALCDWYRFRPSATFDDPFLDAGRTLVLIDTLLWPAAWRAHAPDPPFQAPSLDVAVRFHRAAPTCAWLLCDAVAPVAADGLIGGQASIWSADGRLLASGGGQLLCRALPATT
jgi:acyl-CoA thioesterase-2